MAIIDSYYSMFFIWFSSSLLVYVFLTKKLRKSQTIIHLPPSPPALPFIGHIHLMSKNMTNSLQNLALRYGPLMRISIGSFTSLVVSDAVIAEEVMKKNDLNFAYKPVFGASDYSLYKKSSFFAAEYGTYWRFLKKLCMSELLSTTQVNRSMDIRNQEIVKLLEVVLKCSERREACNLGEELMKMTNNIICILTLSTRCSASANESKMIKEFVNGVSELSAKLSLGDLLVGPLKKFDMFGYGRRLQALFMKYDDLVEGILKEHEKELRNGDSRERKDMMDILLEISKDETAEVKLSRDDLKSFIMEMFLAGTDTTGATLQWILAEIINHPNAFEKLRREIMTVVGTKRLVQDSDIPNLPYLQAIVKESLRLHPPIPLILRRCKEDCKINGYDVLSNSTIMFNLHAIMRNPESWENPTEFLPDRFVDKCNEHEKMNPKGQELHYLPFGSGRRACPGASLALAVVHVTVATLVQCFDLETKGGEKVDMEVKSGASAGMARPLVCYPVMSTNPLKLTNVA